MHIKILHDSVYNDLLDKYIFFCIYWADINFETGLSLPVYLEISCDEYRL